MHGGMEVQLHAFLTSAIYGSEWSASRLSRFTPGERALDTHWIGGWVGPRAGLDEVEKRKIPSPHGGSNPDRTARSLVDISAELCRLHYYV
jgi:hypothetical protein